MEPVMWLELLSRHHDVLQRHRYTGPIIRIGRGYDNDLVLDDPHVAPRHLQLSRTESGGWLAQDLGSANGLRAEHGKGRFDSLALDEDKIFRIGTTLLRLRSEHYPVAAERVDARRIPLWPVALLLAIGILGIELVVDWLTEVNELRLPVYLYEQRWLVLGVPIWAGFWAILSHVFARHARFERHLVIVLAGIFSFSASDEVLKYLGFALSMEPVLGYEYLIKWALAGLVCFCHLQQVAPRRWRLSAGVTAGLALLVAGATTLQIGEDHRNIDPPPIQGQFYPPALRLIAPQTDDAFFAHVAKLREELDSGRKDDDR
jgi:Inner membrane component of T3SS, cytoplasmic domain